MVHFPPYKILLYIVVAYVLKSTCIYIYIYIYIGLKNYKKFLHKKWNEILIFKWRFFDFILYFLLLKFLYLNHLKKCGKNFYYFLNILPKSHSKF